MNCPHNFDVCDCGLYNPEKDTCGYFSPPMPMSEILTPLERIDRLNPKVIPVSNSAITELKSKFLYLNNKLNTHIEKKRRKPLKIYD